MASEAEQQIRRVTACGDDYYAVLGLGRGASEDEIKKAYRKLALRLHPDKCQEAGAEEAFKIVAEAFSVLTDQEKRPVYDRYGAEGLRSGGGGGGGGGSGPGGPGVFFRSSRSGPPVDAFNIFEQFFGGRDPFAEMDEMFAGMHGGRSRGGSTPGGAGRAQGFGGGFGGMFQDDPFFSGGGMGGGSGFSSSMSTSFGGGGGGTSFSSFSSSSMGGGGMVGSSSSTTTRIVNGKRMTVTEKTVRNADGTTETTRSESEGDGGGPQGMIGGDFFGGSPFGGSFFGGGGGRNRAATGPRNLGY